MNYAITITTPDGGTVSRSIPQEAAARIMAAFIATRTTGTPVNPVEFLVEQILGDLIALTSKHESEVDGYLGRQKLEELQAAILQS